MISEKKISAFMTAAALDLDPESVSALVSESENAFVPSPVSGPAAGPSGTAVRSVLSGKQISREPSCTEQPKNVKKVRETFQKTEKTGKTEKTAENDIPAKTGKAAKTETSRLQADPRAGDFLKTKESEAVYTGILKLAREFCHTAHARNYIEKMVPYPASRMDRICAVREKMAVYGALTENIPAELSETVSKLLSGITPAEDPEPSRSTDKAIIAFTEKTFTQAREKFGSYLRVHLVSDATECRDLFSSYRSVILFDFPEFELPGDNYVYFKDISKTSVSRILPESDMAYFIRNRKSIQSALTLSALLMDEKILMSLPDIDIFGGEISGSPDTGDGHISKEEIEKVLEILSGLDKDGKPEPGKDPEYSRLKNIYENIDEAVLQETAVAAGKMSDALAGAQLTLDGAQMMQIFSGSADLRSIIASQVSGSYETAVKEALESLSLKFSLKPDEAGMLRFLFGEEMTCPLRTETKCLDAFKKEIASDLRKKEDDCCKKAAAELSARRGQCDSLINACLDFDIWYSLSLFASSYCMHFPAFETAPGKSGTGSGKSDTVSGRSETASGKSETISGRSYLSVVNGRNLSLVRKAGFDKIEPVSYDVDGVVLLSGVNSGGKTSLLDLCSQCIILAHMGLPVPAEECRLTPTEEFYYFGKSKGTLDAGAFETTLRNFSVVTGNKDKIVFADELESITEPGASARIIAGLLETLAMNSNILSVFVSHLSEAIAGSCDIPIRIDGIDASGLDENLNLIINRTPVKNHVAKSTPELIVEKLVLSSSGTEKEFYENLRKKFRNN